MPGCVEKYFVHSMHAQGVRHGVAKGANAPPPQKKFFIAIYKILKNEKLNIRVFLDIE